jgi:hypothetical protein
MSLHLSLALLSVVLDASAGTRRFALVAGANDGGAARPQLLYAGTDAQAVARVLTDLGGVAPADTVLLLEPDSASLEAGLQRMQALLQSARSGGRTELLFYYSGHSDETGLLLRGERYAYATLLRQFSALGADVRIAILDSCYSGAMVRYKGGVQRPPFLVDESIDVKGQAFLTSSSAHEPAQESDRVRGSFFTHYLVSGLRGAADTTGDGRVSLTEAYQFAFAQTLARTQGTRHGAQHPAYDIQLAGTGDVVMTDLHDTAASLYLDEAIEGRVFVRDGAGDLVVELNGHQGHPVEVALPPGPYHIVVEQQGQLYSTDVLLAQGARTAVPASSLTVAPQETAQTRGGTVAPSARAGEPSDFTDVDFVVGVLPGVSTAGNDAQRVRAAFQVNLLAGRVGAQDGFAYSFGATLVEHETDGVQLAPALNYSGGALAGLQLAGAANLGGSAVTGAQIAGAFNYAGGSLDGAQVAGGFNVVGGAVWGAQVAGGVNVAEGVAGAQVAPVNIADDVAGAQIGVLNIAHHVNGLQLGVINIADDVQGVPIALFSFVANGEHHLQLTLDDLGMTTATARFGSRYFQTFFSAAVKPQSGPVEWSYGGGLGFHLPVEPWFVNLDVATRHVQFREGHAGDAIFPSVNVTLGYAFYDHLSILVGASLNVAVGWNGAFDNRELTSLPGWDIASGRTAVRMYPGFFTGLQF